jgi:hypothetical protein
VSRLAAMWWSYHQHPVARVLYMIAEVYFAKTHKVIFLEKKSLTT